MQVSCGDAEISHCRSGESCDEKRQRSTTPVSFPGEDGHGNSKRKVNEDVINKGKQKEGKGGK